MGGSGSVATFSISMHLMSRLSGSENQTCEHNLIFVGRKERKEKNERRAEKGIEDKKKDRKTEKGRKKKRVRTWGWREKKEKKKELKDEKMHVAKIQRRKQN